MRRIHARLPLRGITIVVFAVLLGGSLTASTYARRVLDDQEHRMLAQRAAEAAALLTNFVSQAEGSARSLAAVTLATDNDPARFAVAASRDPGLADGGAVALVREIGGHFEVVAAQGAGLTAGQELTGPAAAAVARARTTDGYVHSGVFPAGAERRIGGALRVSASPESAVIYRELVVPAPGQRRRLTSSAPFSEIEAVLYAAPVPDPEQLLLATRTGPLRGRTARQTVTVGGDRWLFEVAANRTLVGTLAAREPWLLLARGLILTVLVTALVEALQRRRRYTQALEMAHQALHDALTGLPNRLLVSDRLEQALERSARTGSEVAVLFVDLDRFKLINDSRGHAAGDELLMTVAERLSGVVRRDDVVARFGGDEFVIVCEDDEAALEASLLAERILAALREPVLVGGQEVFLSASVGIATSANSAALTTPSSLLRDADAAMYRAKEKGRDRSEFFDATMRTEATKSLEIQSALHRAIERDELLLHYQPVVDLVTGEVAGVEALVRWAHPTHGLVSPAQFIPLAEETGLIVPIGAWVVAEATNQLARWRRQSWGRSLRVSVNLSARQLRRPELIPDLMAALLTSGLDSDALCLELTETTFMEDGGHHRETLAGLRKLGLGLAIDDFGTGYSSLTYLKRFPVTVLKIDQAFVRGLGEDAADSAIVRSVIDLAHALGLLVVAEGVETAAQVDHLRALGCDLAQGYWFARPQPAAELEALLSGRTVCKEQDRMAAAQEVE